MSNKDMRWLAARLRELRPNHKVQNLRSGMLRVTGPDGGVVLAGFNPHHPNMLEYAGYDDPEGVELGWGRFNGRIPFTGEMEMKAVADTLCGEAS